MPSSATNCQAVDMWTMRLRRTGHAPWTTLTRCPPRAPFAHMTTAFHHE